MTAEKTKVTVPVQAGSQRPQLLQTSRVRVRSRGGYQLSVAISVWQIFGPHSPSGIDTSTLYCHKAQSELRGLNEANWIIWSLMSTWRRCCE